MVDMVVHRHKMRETLAKLCHILMSGAPAAKGRSAPGRVNGKAYVNGAPVDSKLIETAARETGGVIDPEVVPASQRFEPGKGKREGDGPSQGHLSGKDVPRGG